MLIANAIEVEGAERVNVVREGWEGCGGVG